MRILIAAALLLVLAGCSGQNSETATSAPDEFFASLTALCGKAFTGRVVSTDEADATFASEALVMHVRRCDENQIRIPFHVGENRSRTWVITRTNEGLRLKHDHRHEDGAEDDVTQYGGDSAAVSPTRAEFPVDQYSVEMFIREGLTASVTNVWAVDVTEDMFAYELSRENRFFRVEFDLSKSIDAPPPWGAEAL